MLSLSKHRHIPRLMAYFFAYLLRCNDGSFYAGHTDDLEQRIAQHMSGTLGGYTSIRLPVELVWSDMFLTRDEAFAAERKLKGWSRAKKQALLVGDWNLISILARNRQGLGVRSTGSAGASTGSA